MILQSDSIRAVLSRGNIAKHEKTGKDTMKIALLKAAALFASKDQYRYYLAGVYVHQQDDKTRVVATDGKVLFAAQCADAADVTGSGIIPLTLINQIKAPKNIEDCTITIVNDRVTIDYAGQSVQSATIDGTFPAYGRALPAEYDTQTPAQYDPDNTILFKKAAKLLDAGSIYIHQNGENPAIVRIGDEKHDLAYNCFGIIMPLRESVIGSAKPYHSWARA
jgi:hypothetical protein